MRATSFILVLGLAGCAVSTPLPDFTIKQPAATVASHLAAFSGKWTGRWGGELDGTLIVEEISGRNAKLVYSWGSLPRMNMSPGFRHVDGVFGEDNVLRATLGPNTRVSYRLTSTGTLEGRWESAQQTASATFKRAEK